jgi:predicted PurR-regulated permease PerM
MGFIKDLLSGGAGNVITAVGNVIDNLTTSKEEKMQLELEMKKADQQYQVDLKKLSLEEQKNLTAEMDSARKREVDLSASPYATKLSKNVTPFLAIGTTILTFSLFLFILLRTVDADKK